MTQKPLSPKAIGLLVEIYRRGAPRGSAGLQERFQEGRAYIDSGLKELFSMGLIEAVAGKTQKGQFFHTLNITDAGIAYVKTEYFEETAAGFPLRETSISISLNSHLADYPNSIRANSVKRMTNGVRQKKKKYKTMEVNVNDFGGTPMDPDDIAELKAKDKKRKDKARIDQKTERMEAKAMDRATRTVEEWTAQDSVSYFAEQINSFWHIPDYRMNKQTFFFAFKNFQTTYGTDGPVEKALIDAYISSIKQDTSLKDPEHIWRRFIKMAPSMVEEARRASVSDDRLNEIRANALTSKTRRDL